MARISLRKHHFSNWAWFSISLFFVSSAALADPLATGSACGQSLSLSRDPNGLVTLNLGRASTPLGSASGPATFESLATQRGSTVIARVREGEVPALAAVVYCDPSTPPSVLWHGDLRWQGEDLGQRVRAEVLTLDTDGDGRPELLLGTRHESLSLCGASLPLLDARRLDGTTGRLLSFTLDPQIELNSQGTQRSVTVTAEPTALTPLLPLRGLTVLSQGSSQSPRALLDNDPLSALSLPRPGLVTAQIDRGPALFRALHLTAPAAPGTLPRRFTLLAFPGPLRFELVIPEALARTPGQRLRLPIPDASSTRCVVLVPTDSDGALAELHFESSLDDSPDPVAALAALADSPGGEDAARLLSGLGPPGMRALANALPTLSAPSARRALRFLDNLRGLSPADQRALSSAVVSALARDDIALAAVATLRSHGPAALAPLTDVVATEARASSVIASLSLPSQDRARALSAALDAEPGPWRAARAALRNVLPALARDGQEQAWIDALPESPRALSRGLRAAAESIGPGDPLRARIAQRALTLWREPSISQSAGFEVRYRILAAMVGDPEGRAAVREALAHDPDPDLRAESARVLRGTEGSHEALRTALSDRVPRVRAAAATALAGLSPLRADLARALATDPWPTVRVAAIEALTGDPEASLSLLGALGQSSFAVVHAALLSLGRTPGDTVGAALVAFADDGRHNPALRALSLESLGTRCDPAVVPELVRFASSLSDPSLPPNVQALGHTALASLASIDPERARRWLAEAEANAQATAAVRRAMRARCVRPW